MSTQDHAALIQRMIKRPQNLATPSGRGPEGRFRRAVVKAAGDLGLKPAVREVEQSFLGLTDFLTALDRTGWLLVVIDGDDGARGAVALNAVLVTAIIEIQTLGRLSGLPASDRPLTRTDAAISEPFISGILTLLQAPSDSGEPPRFTFGAAVGDLHGLGIVLDDRQHCVSRARFTLEGAAEEGELYLALPQTEKVPDQQKVAPVDQQWSKALSRNVQEASVEIDVVLYRMKLPLQAVQELAAGQVLDLPGHVLGQAGLEVGGEGIGYARLGQAGAMRAIKLNGEDAPENRREEHKPLDAAPAAEVSRLPAE